MSDVLTTAHNLALQVAPELADWPLYLVPCEPAWLPHDCLGAHLSWIDPLWMTRLQERGQWRGNGRLIALAAEALELPRQYLCGVVTHELAHALPAIEPSRLFAPTAENLALCQQWAAEDARQGVDDFPGGSAEMHGAGWVRRLVHLRYRALQAGVTIPWSAFNVRHGQCHISIMARRLGDEPARLASASFQEIETIEPPVEFTTLWQTGA